VAKRVLFSINIFICHVDVVTRQNTKIFVRYFINIFEKYFACNHNLAASA